MGAKILWRAAAEKGERGSQVTALRSWRRYAPGTSPCWTLKVPALIFIAIVLSFVPHAMTAAHSQIGKRTRWQSL